MKARTDRRAFFATAALAIALFPAGCGGGEGETPEAEGTATTATAEQPVPISEGDAERGKMVFAAMGCGNCHTFKAAGSRQNVGPNLDLVVKTYDAEFVRESIVDPEAYREKIGETPGSIGSTKAYHGSMPPYGPKAEVDERRLTQQQIADLVVYLLEFASR